MAREGSGTVAVSSLQAGMCCSSLSHQDFGLESSIHPWARLCVPFLSSGWAVLTTPQLLIAVLRGSNRNPSLFPSPPCPRRLCCLRLKTCCQNGPTSCSFPRLPGSCTRGKSLEPSHSGRHYPTDSLLSDSSPASRNGTPVPRRFHAPISGRADASRGMMLSILFSLW